MIFGSTAFFVVSLVKFIDTMGTIEYIELGNEKIPTIYMIDNNIQIDDYNKEISNGEYEVEVTYYDDLLLYDIFDRYIDFLEENEFTCVENDYNEGFLVKKSVDDGMIILVNIYEAYDYDGELYFTILYEKVYDDFSNYVKEITYKRVGEEKYGYIDINSEWLPYLNYKDMVQYEGDDGFLSLYYIENPGFNAREYMNSIQTYLLSDGVEDIEISEVKVDGYDAYQLYGYYPYDKMYMTIWCFLDNNNIMHYIEIDTFEYDSEAFSKIESYSVTK